MHCEFNSQCERIDLWNQAVRFYNIEVSQEDWTFINDKNQFIDEPYVPCNFTMNYQQENEKLFEFAMVKVKGSQGGKVACEYGINSAVCRSPSYQINIDKNLPENFDKEEPKVGGKDKLQFHSMMNDESLMIERLSYSIMHHYLNISTARAVHCVLFVNGEKLGVFLNVEELNEKSIGPILFGEKGDMMKDTFPQKWFTSSTVWRNLINESLQCVSEDRLQMKCTPEQGRTILKKHIDTDSYVKAMLANNLLNNFDGPPKSVRENYYWFVNKNNDPWVFVPWDYNNLIMLKLCKVNNDTGLIEGYGDIDRNSSVYIYREQFFTGVCDAPPFQYLPSTMEERQVVCDCVTEFAQWPGKYNTHMSCLGEVSTVLSQSLVDDYFNYRNDAFKGNEINVENEVKSMVEYWSNQIRTHINASAIIYPMKNVWEERIKKIPLFFDYGLEQLMNRKKELKDEDIDAHFEWIKNRAKELGKCQLCQSDLECKNYASCENGSCIDGFCFDKKENKKCPENENEESGCQSTPECQQYARCETGFCNDQDSKCYVQNLMGEECEGIVEYKNLGDGFCYDEKQFTLCTTTAESESEVSTAESEVSTAESESEVSTAESKSIFSRSEVSTSKSKGKEKSEVSTAESTNVFSKTFGIAAILILLSFIL